MTDSRRNSTGTLHIGRKSEQDEDRALEKQASSSSKVWKQLLDKPTEQDRRDAQTLGIDENMITERKEVWAWWTYDWANTSFGVIGLGLAWPVICTVLAEQYACKHRTDYGCDYDRHIIALDGDMDDEDSSNTLRVSMSGWKLKPESYAAAMIAISGIFQMALYVGM